MSGGPEPNVASVNGWNAEYLEAQYASWESDPGSVSPDLGRFFEGFRLGQTLSASNGVVGGAVGGGMSGGGKAVEDRAQSAVTALVQRYRELGHLCAAIDPFGREREMPACLTPQHHGLGEVDLGRTFDADHLHAHDEPMRLSDIIEWLDDTYCGSVGAEIEHILDDEERGWLIERMERSRNRLEFTREQRRDILEHLYRSELFEKFCGKRYPGMKRFSLEGGESLIPLLEEVIRGAGDSYGVQEIVFAMSHRGRLNVLTNIIGKTYEQIFTEFDDAWSEDAELGGGDVKYHRGYSENRVLGSGKSVWLAMASNPSHLESACGVALGRCRGKQRLRGDVEREMVIPLLIHGDAAVIGQGVVAEVYNLSQLPGYTTGGTVHIVVNNLIGFTTGPEEARSCRYCTDIAKMIEAPIFHVNGEDPEAVVHVARLALDYRMKFKKDVVIDMVCYRRHGHNESDEAMFTQPKLYAQIKQKPSVVEAYAERLQREGTLSEEELERIHSNLHENLDRAYDKAKESPVDPTPNPGFRRWVGVSNTFGFDAVNTSVEREDLLEVSRAMGFWPEGFTPHRKLLKTIKDRSTCIEEDRPFDWAMGEQLAIGSLLIEGIIVRFSGQDSRRGTFSHRHAALRDVDTSELYVPLNHIRECGEPGTDKEVGTVNEDGKMRQAKFCIYDSPLSEYAVLGFEYGFSLASPQTLTIWEAQFGDFANGAQVIIDQFIASAEAKWQRWSALVMLLPHGYEGQGPEHSSARIERFLKLCGQGNMQVCHPTTPGQYFHLLRRQVMRNFRKPLIVMSPKSLLRHPECRSLGSELTEGVFQEIVDDPRMTDDSKQKVKRIVLCSGKVFYDLDARRQEIEREDIALVRVEQLYPLHFELLGEIVRSYRDGAEVVWVQEEPKNMGAWGHMALALKEEFGWDLPYIGRGVSASPATGSAKKHGEQLEQLLSESVGAVEKSKVAAGAA